MRYFLGYRWVLFAITLFPQVLRAQADAELKFYVQPSRNIQFIMDGKRLQHVMAARLTEGDHHFVFYAPGFSLLDTTVHMEAGQDKELRKVLVPSPEYVQYHKEQLRISTQRLLWKGVPGLATVVFGVMVMNAHKKHDEAYDELHALSDSYAGLTNGDDINGLKEVSIPAAKDELRSTRSSLVTTMVLCGASAAVTVYGFIRSAHYKAPVYEDKAKIKFDGLAWLPGSGGGQLLTGITIPLR